MITIINESKNPYFNLALEEYLLKSIDLKEDIFYLWQNLPSIIIGRNQNTIQEINQEAVKKYNLHVARRLSGGGAVYHDLGNLNFTFISKYKDQNFQTFTKPVIKTLNHLGVDASFSGRNDITIDNKKISGNAQCFHKNKILHHGTILFNTDLERVSEVLNVSQDKIESKGIKSIRSRVTNIYPYLNSDITLDTFKTILLKEILQTNQISKNEYHINENDFNKIKKIMDEKYLTWEWNYGESPEFNFKKSLRFPSGKLEILLNVAEGVIKGCKIYGDFFGMNDLSLLERSLINQRFDEETMSEYVKTIELDQYISQVTNEDFLNCLFSN